MKILTIPQMIEYVGSRKVLVTESGKVPKNGFFLDCVCAFDIETTVIYPEEDNPQAIMYIWQFACDDQVTYGRYWADYEEMINQIKERIPKETRILTYVHNLSYEFQFLSGIFHFYTEDVFCIQPRKILYARCEPMEYRCSMLLSNDSLAGFCDKHKVEHRKQSGDEFDYSKIRYPWTPLTPREMKYCLFDVIGLVECIRAEMKMNNDTLYTIPMTSTGYVRRDVKRVLYRWNRQHQYYLQPTTEHLYRRLKECFRGGNTHANRYFANQTLPKEDGPYWSYDISSSYPAQILLEKYPMSTWREGPTDPAEIADLRGRGYCMLLIFRATNVRLRNKYNGFPPLSESKCRNFLPAKNERDREIPDDNGRITAATYLETTMTDLDFDIFLKNYDAEIEFLETWYCCYGYLPKALRDYVRQLYIDKTALKGKEGSTPEETELIAVRYMQSKARINSVYGLMVQDNIKPLIQYDDGEYIEDPDFDIEEELKKNQKKAYLSYSWGCWVTAWARKELEDAIRNVENQNGYPVYCDTDSVKGCGPADFTELNKERIYKAKKHKAFADDVKGSTHYIGLFEQEHDMDEFRTLGAKKYAYTIDGKTYITIAGVGKKAGAKILQDSGGLDQLKEGFIFRGATSDAIYNDTPYGAYFIDGKGLYINKNVALVPGDYTVGLTAEYGYILEHPEIFYDVWRTI